MKSLSVFGVLVTVAVFSAAPAVGVVTYKIDLGGTWSGIGPAAGYTALWEPNVNRFNNGTAVSLGGGVSVGWVHNWSSAWNWRDRGGADTLLREFVYVNYAAPVDPIQFRGLTPGDYTLTLYADDYWYAHSSMFDIDQNNDGVADQTVAISCPATIQKTVNVTVSSAGILQIGLYGAGGSAGVCNGFDLVSVPEPATMLLLVGGLAVGAIRRRAR